MVRGVFRREACVAAGENNLGCFSPEATFILRPTIMVPENRNPPPPGFPFVVLKLVSSAVGSDGPFLFAACTRKNVLFA